MHKEATVESEAGGEMKIFTAYGRTRCGKGGVVIDVNAAAAGSLCDEKCHEEFSFCRGFALRASFLSLAVYTS
jgi:hypothetical protein